MEEKKHKEEKGFTLLEAKRIVGLKTMAYKDYIAARNLYNSDLIHQASFFANTAIEKELKCYLEVTGSKVKISHEVDKIYNLLDTQNKKIAEKINNDFLKALSKIYLSRYFEKLEPGYNFIILRNKLLAELDYTYSTLECLTRFRDNPETAFERDKKEKKDFLFKNNYLLLNIPKKEFICQADLAYEFRILPNHEILEVLYTTNQSIDDSKFIYESLKPIDNHSVQLAQLKKV